MKNYQISNLMVPLCEYATVPVGSTLFEAVLALEKAQEEFDHTKYKHRGILILNKENKVIGKLNHLNALNALAPLHDKGNWTNELAEFGFSAKFARNLYKKQRRHAAPLESLCKRAAGLKVEDFMQVTAEDECIDHQANLDMAIHQLVQEKLHSLLVIQDGNIIGILRLADVFAAVFHSMTAYAGFTGAP